MKRLKIKVTLDSRLDFDGYSIEKAILELQSTHDRCHESHDQIFIEYDYHGYNGEYDISIVGFREENDKEFNKRTKELEKTKARVLKADDKEMKRLQKLYPGKFKD